MTAKFATAPPRAVHPLLADPEVFRLIEAERQRQDQKKRAAHYSTTRGTRKAVSVGGRQMRSSQTA